MDQIKKHLFWIILGVVVAAGVGIWVMMAPDSATAKEKALGTADKIDSLAKNPNKIHNDAYAKAAEAYAKEVDAQKSALLKKWESQKIDVKFTDIPGKDKTSIEFDTYIAKLRDQLAAKMTAASVKVPDNFKDFTFGDSGSDDKSQDIRRHRDFRLRYMALLDEAVDALCSKTGSITKNMFQTDPDTAESTTAENVGPVALLKFTFHTPEDRAKLEQRDYEKALGLAQRRIDTAHRDAGFKGPDVPFNVSSFDIEFLSHVSAIPGVIRKLESSSRYFGIVTKADFERAVPIFPDYKQVKDPKDALFKAAYIPHLNTHYGEGPVKVLISFDVYEYDKKKAEEFEKGPAPAPKVPAKK